MDIKKVAETALPLLPALLPEILPGGRTEGREYVCADLAGGPGKSCKVNTQTGRWADFADNSEGASGGDVVSLVAATKGLSQAEAARWVAERTGQGLPRLVPSKSPPEVSWTPITPVPEDAPAAPAVHPKYGRPSMAWFYRDANGGLLQIINRYDTDTGKQIIPLTYCKNADGRRQWRRQSLPEPRPLYGLDAIGQKAVIPEGEKATDAVRRILGSRSVVTWSGGSNAVGKTDWSPVEGKEVAICPDADTPGYKAAVAVAEACLAAGAITVKIMEPPGGVAEGWDLADAEAEGWTRDQLLESLRAAISVEEFREKYLPDLKISVSRTVHEANDEVPEPLPLRRTLPPSEPFPVDTLPEVLRGMHAKTCEIVQSPEAMVGQGLLASACLAVQGLANVGIDGREFPLSEFFVTVGESGERKTATDNAGLVPHRRREKALAEEAQREGINFEIELAAWKKEKEAALRAENGEKIRAALTALGPEPLPPLKTGLITEEPTYEGLVKQLAEGQPSIGIFSSEGGRFIGGHAMNKDNQLKTSTGLSSLWDGTPLTRTRSGDGSLTLYGRRVCLHLMLQPNVAGELLSNDMLIGQGLLSRCLLTFPESTIGKRPYREIDLSQTQEARAYYSTLQAILEMRPALAEGSRNELNPRLIHLARQAKTEWIGFHDHIERLMNDGKELAPIRGFAAKAAEHAARLAGILTLVEDPQAGEIPLEKIQAGIFLAQFYTEEALRLFHNSNDSPEIIKAEKCLQWIKENGPTISLPDLYQKGPSCVRSKKDAMKALEMLEEHHWVLRIDGPVEVNGQKRQEAWRYSG